MSPELEAKIRDILVKMSMLAEGATMNFDAKVSSKMDSVIPPNVSLRSGIPDKDRVSLWEWWSWRFLTAIASGESEQILYELWQAADAEYMATKYFNKEEREKRSGEAIENDRLDGGATEAEQAKRVATASKYEGMSPLEVAESEKRSPEGKGAVVTEAWVIKARKQHGRNAADGRPKPEWHRLDEDAKRRKASELKARDIGTPKAAEILGISRRTLREYWPREDASISPIGSSSQVAKLRIETSRAT